MGAPWTPGPWRVSPRFKSADVAAHPVPGMRGSDDVPGYGGHLVAESVAPQNVPLIAAAPDLAEALEPFASEANALLSLGLTLNDEDGPVTIIVPSAALRRARAALSKAKGETA